MIYDRAYQGTWNSAILISKIFTVIYANEAEQYYNIIKV